MRLRAIALFFIAVCLFPALIRAQEKHVVVPSYQRIEFHLDSTMYCASIDVSLYSHVIHGDQYQIRKYKLEHKLFNKIVVCEEFLSTFIIVPEQASEFLWVRFAIDGLIASIDITKGLFTTVYMQPLQSEVLGQPSLSGFSAMINGMVDSNVPIDRWPYHFSSKPLQIEEKFYTDDNTIFYPEHSLHANGCSKWYLDQELISTDDTLRWNFPQKGTYRLRSVSVSSSLTCPDDSIVSEIDLHVFDRKNFVFWDTILQNNLLQITDTFLSHEKVVLTDTLELQIPVVVQDTTIERDTLYIHDTLLHNRNSPEPGAKYSSQTASQISSFINEKSFTSSAIDSKKNILSPSVIVPCQQHIYLFSDTTIPASGIYTPIWNAALKMDSSLRCFLYATPFKPNDTKLFLSDYNIIFAFSDYYKNGVFSTFNQGSYPIEYIKDSILGELAYACKKSCHIHNDSEFYEVISYEAEYHLPPHHLKHKEIPLHLSLYYGESRTFVAEEPSPQGCARWYWNDSLIAYGDTLQKEFTDSGSFKLSLVTTNEYMDCATDSILSDVWIEVGPRPRVCCDTVWTTDTIRIIDTLVLYDTTYRQDTIWIFDTLHLPLIIRKTDTIYVIDTLYQAQIRLQAPTAIAPLGREENRQFRFFATEGIVQMQLHIYDRWGKLLHQVIGPPGNCQWDATHNRKPVAPGTYLWVVRWKDQQGDWRTDRGWVVVITS